mgnify:CR=1 FL=1
MLNIATKGSVFYFSGRYYRQVDGVAMGSPLGPALANIFLCHHEINWLRRCPSSFTPILYKRYVDDIFVLMDSKKSLMCFFRYMNSKHPNISFTYETEENDKLPFLDILVCRSNGQLVTSIFRKSTFSGVYLHFCSFMPIEYKFGLINTLLHRCYTLVSSYEMFHLEVVKLKDIIKNNGYPVKIFDKCVQKFLMKIFECKPPIHTVKRKEISLFLPYLGKISLVLRSNLVKIVSKSFPSYKLNVIFKSANRLGSYFNFKDKIPKSLISGVVYKYLCNRCNSVYIGKTKRYWEKRLEEHLSVSALTGKPMKTQQVWPPMEHSKSCQGSTLSRERFCIVGREKNDFLLKIQESIKIYQCNPTLNKQNESTRLYLFT